MNLARYMWTRSAMTCVIVLIGSGFPIVAMGLDSAEMTAQLLVEAVQTDKIYGVTLAPIEDTRLGPVGYGSKRADMALTEIAYLGSNWISLTPFGRMDDLDSTEIQHDFEIPVERNEKLIAKTIARAHELGLKVALIPHVYVMSGGWRGRILPKDDEGVEQWFRSYEQFLLRFALLAQETGADLFSIGVEFGSTTNYFEDRWRRVIELVRSTYSGAITYSANWDEVEFVPFWDALDYIGLNAFWPIARKPGEGFLEMRRNAVSISRDLEVLAIYWNRPILFTEFGIKSARDSAIAPWEWPEHSKNLVYDEEYQAQSYDAVLDVMTEKPWFKGLFIWKFICDPYDETQEARTGFSPRNKLAEGVLFRWYHKRWNSRTIDLHLE
jgi:hypothetical protein